MPGPGPNLADCLYVTQQIEGRLGFAAIEIKLDVGIDEEELRRLALFSLCAILA